jgi:hypothetical protein
MPVTTHRIEIAIFLLLPGISIPTHHPFLILQQNLCVIDWNTFVVACRACGAAATILPIKYMYQVEVGIAFSSCDRMTHLTDVWNAISKSYRTCEVYILWASFILKAFFEGVGTVFGMVTRQLLVGPTSAT